ncbi:MAG: DUF3147 family protein [Candidatus Sulfotelmatobacter sp.]|jgi:hypothetical protein
MEILHAHCAGLDIHKDSVVACARHMVEGKVTSQVKTFKTTTQELMALSDWLSAEGVAGIIAKEFGPGIGGLFLAFPAIFPASATLIEKHEKRKKEKDGLDGTLRGREAASIDAAGSAMGGIGLLVFALLFWQFAPRHHPCAVLTCAAVAWFTVSVLIWQVRKMNIEVACPNRPRRQWLSGGFLIGRDCVRSTNGGTPVSFALIQRLDQFLN